MPRAQMEKLNPFRSPCWRFDRVLQLVSRRPQPLPASRLSDDRYIRAYRTFLLQFEQNRTRESQWFVGEKYPDVFYAHLLHHHPDSEYRSLLQARILSGLSIEEIARNYLGTSPAAIDFYEHLFYDVRDRLSCTDYIIKVILGRWEDRQANRMGALTAYQSDMMLKLFGYWGGPVLLDYVVSAGSSMPKVKKAEECGAWLDQLWERLARIKSATAMYSHPFDRTTLNTLFDAHYRLLDLSKQAELGDASTKEYHRNVETCLKSLSWSFGQRGTASLAALPQKYTKTSIEPRAAELLALAEGQEPQQLMLDATTEASGS